MPAHNGRKDLYVPAVPLFRYVVRLPEENVVTLEGQVITEDSHVASKCAIEVILEAEERIRRPAQTDTHGRFTVAGLPPGTYRASVRLMEFATPEREIHLTPTKVESGIWILPTAG